ncbi:cupin domain-containing protein [Halomicrococcus sp. SG-WS-1]|uniref:cupin domain-containing protein n=1 Tax=Halomicrococcus sp. SG-WS-1 TaxID=3439057 RepID=UPI003F78E7D7
MTHVDVVDLSEKWPDSAGTPLPLVRLEEPRLETGSYLIEPGERVPETGTTRHDGDELSVVLSGTVVLGVDGATSRVGPETLIHIPAGVDHFSENRGDEPVRLLYTILGEL